MSILLDALKKSEEQRRLGTTPTLQTPESSVDLKLGEQRNLIPAVMILLAAGTITWIGLVQFARPLPFPVPVLSSAPAPIESLPTHIPLQAQTTRQAPNSLASNPEVPPATTPVMNFTADDQSTGLEEEQKVTAPGRPASREVVSAVADAPATAMVAAGAEPIAALVEDLSQSDVAARPDSGQLQPYAAEPISYWQIPQSLRETLPEMRITVLVYAVNPQDRFILISGKRLREKDEVSSGLVVDEIQRDRAIFTFRDYRFQVKS